MIDLSRYKIWTEEEFERVFSPASVSPGPAKPNGAQRSQGGNAGAIDEIDEGALTDDLREWIRDGEPAGSGKRSTTFFVVVRELKKLGYSAEAIFDLFERYPDGIAQKYLDDANSGSRERLQREVERAYAKPLLALVAASAAAPMTASGWRQPDPLPDGLLPVAPFDMAFLPARIAPWVADFTELMQCPPDYLAIPAVVALGATLGRKVAIRPQRDTEWNEVANLWGLIVGPPGVMKTPAMGEATKPLRRLEMEARRLNELALKAHAMALEEHKLRAEAMQRRFREALKRDPNALAPFPPVEPEEPKARRYIVDDTTYQKLGDIMASNPNGVLSYRDELMSLLRTLDREESADARGFYLAAWGGKDSYTVDRIGRGTQHIEAACLCSWAEPSQAESPPSSNNPSMTDKAATACCNASAWLCGPTPAAGAKSIAIPTAPPSRPHTKCLSGSISSTLMRSAQSLVRTIPFPI